MGKKVIFIVIILVSIFISGCWDMLDIEERAYVSGIAFDKPSEELEKQREQLEESSVFAPEYNITYINPIPSAQTGDASGEETFNVHTTAAVTPMIAQRQMATRFNLALFFGHTDLVLFGEEILQDSEIVKEMMDYLHRNQQFNWNVNVAVVQGEAKEAFNIKPSGVSHLVEYITGIMENKTITSRVSNVKLNQMMSEMGQVGTAALPKLVVAEDEVKVEGAALIKNFEFEGYFSGMEAQGLMFLKGTLQGGVIMTKYKDVFVPYTIINTQVQPEINVTEEGIEAVFTIESEGQLEEGKFGKELLDDQVIKDIESRIGAEIEENCMEAIEKLQKEYKVDVIYLDDYIRKFHPKVWEEVEEDWIEIFIEMDIKVEADVKIRRTGVIK